MTVEPIDRRRSYFEARYVCEQNSGCWLWVGPLAAGGYGCFVSGKKTRGKAHRLSWELHRGPIPPGKKVCHTCDTPLCVNPQHLFLGTQQDNIADMRRKGRAKNPIPQYGAENPGAKLSWAAVRWARRLRASGLKQRVIAELLGVSTMTINRIVRGQTWRVA